MAIKPIKTKFPTGAAGFLSAHFSVPNITDTEIPFDSEDFGLGGGALFDAATGRMKALPGMWLLTGRLTWDSSGVGFRRLIIRRNGVSPIAQATVMAPPAGDAHTQTILAVVNNPNPLPTDHFSLWVHQNSGAALLAFGLGLHNSAFYAAYLGG